MNRMEYAASPFGIVTIIPTMARVEKVRDAVKSALKQSRAPDLILVIGEKATDIPPEILSNKGIVQTIVNSRTPGLSGAVNSALFHIIGMGYNPDNTYISFLDDDDTWSPNYLHRCIQEAEKYSWDWVISGITRYEAPGEGIQQSIPEKLELIDFLSGNPNIQGSNLFIRMNQLLEAGGYDERMISTTDRDVCARLIMLPGIKYGFVREHLVNHYALDDTTRLSTPGSERKRTGLEYFYHKYGPLMSDQIKQQYRERAERLFNVKLEPSTEKAHPVTRIVHTSCDNMFNIVIGFSAHRLDSTTSLLNDLLKLAETGLEITRTVIIDDLPYGTQPLSTHIDERDFQALNIRIVPHSEIHMKNERGCFGLSAGNTKPGGIAMMRNILHHYLYLESRALANPAVWILDDDIRLEYIRQDMSVHPITSDELVSDFSRLKAQGCDFAIGPITGDPPIPAMSIVRTHLLDLYYNLIAIADNRDIQMEKYSVNHDTDYYYDYSDLHYTHLENPHWNGPITGDALLERFRGILHGKSASRPCYTGGDGRLNLNGPIVRGGNSVILNPACLRDYPNISPDINGIKWKRGDSIWALLATKVGGYKAGRMSFGVRHERNENNGVSLSEDNLLSDFWGSSLLKAMHQFYLSSSNPQIQLSPDEVQRIMGNFDLNLNHRLTIFVLNSSRIRGLIGMLAQMELANGAELSTIESKFSKPNMEEIIRRARSYDSKELAQYIQDLNEITLRYRQGFT